MQPWRYRWYEWHVQFRHLLARFTVAIVLMVALTARISRAVPDAGADGGTEGTDAQAPQAPQAPSADLLDAAFVGKRVVRARAELTGDVFRDTALPTLAVAEGTTYTQALARALLRQVLDTGRFASGTVDVTPETGGVVVVVRVAPRRVLEDITLDLQETKVDRDELLRDLEVGRDAELTAQDSRTIEGRLRAALNKHGYPRAQTTLVWRQGKDDTHVVLRITVSPGAPRTIDRRVFDVTGDGRNVSYESYTVSAGDVADERRLDAADVELQNKLRGLGFFDAETSHEVVFQHEVTTLHVKVVLGLRSRSTFTGAQSYDDDALRGALGLESDSDRSSGHLVDKLQAFYTKRGFLDAEVSVEERTTRRGRTLAFKIRENPRVKVRERTYPCFQPADLEQQATEVAPRTPAAIGREVDSFLEEELPGGDLLQTPRPPSFSDAVDHPLTRGSRPTPLELNPNATFVAETYAKAALHVQELYRADGYLSAIVGPVQMVRRRCEKHSPPGVCIPVKLTAEPADVCLADRRGLPIAKGETDASLMCVPDPARGIVCEPEVAVRIPIRLGPRTTLYDAMFQGVKAESPDVLLKESGLQFGKAASQLRVEEARRTLTQYYQELGYAYAQVRVNLERSPDQSRARVVFDVIEGEQVRIRNVVIRGNNKTVESVIRRRIAFAVGDVFRTSTARKSQERIATLGTFSSVSVALDDSYVPERWKTVVITVVEPTAGALNGELGISSGEGVRAFGEVGYRNWFGRAINTTLSAQVSYLPTAWVLDPGVQKNFSELSLGARLPVRIVGSVQFPDTGLGPLVRAQIDPFFVHDLQRDYYIRKFAAVPSITFSPVRELRITLSQSFEYNEVRIFQEDFLAFQRKLVASGLGDRLNSLLVPDGGSTVSAQKLAVVWDRRDNSLDATSGTQLGFSVEHVDAFNDAKANGIPNPDSHFLKLTQTFSGYIPIYGKLRIAAQLRSGVNVQLTDSSVTYTDRLFFLGGSDSMRAWFPSTFIPQDDADLIEAEAGKTVQVPTYGGSTSIPDPERFTAKTRPVRGGNLMVNPRVELRIPMVNMVETALFADFGNLWTDANYPFRTREFPLRVAIGTGVRIQTPVFPVVFDVGFNPWRRFYDDRPWAFNFSIGLF